MESQRAMDVGNYRKQRRPNLIQISNTEPLQAEYVQNQGAFYN